MIPVPDRLADLLGEAMNQAAILRLHGQPGQATTLETFRNQVSEALADWLDWLTEEEAMTRSGKGVTWLRSRFGEWASVGLGKWSGKGQRAKRVYCRGVVPQRANVDAAYREGRAA